MKGLGGLGNEEALDLEQRVVRGIGVAESIDKLAHGSNLAVERIAASPL